jgi:hypothetical protein
VPPLDGPASRVTEAVDRERPSCGRNTQQALLGLGRYDRADGFPSSRDLHSGAAGEFVVERGVGEVDVEKRGGDSGGQPDRVECEGLACGEAEAFEAEQRGGCFQLEPVRDDSIGTHLAGPDDARLAEPRRFDRGEQGVQRPERLRDRDVPGEPRAAAALGYHQPVRAQLAQG